MSASAIEMFFVHSVDVQTYLGASGVGDSYAAAVSVACFIDDSTHFVRSSTGEEVVSNTVVYAAEADAAKFTVESKVTANGRVARVITQNSYDSGPLGLPDHVEVHLT